jgi:hypothetical protein
MKCLKCESTNVREINVEMAFARGKAEPVYVAGQPIVCLNCGFVDISVPQGELAQLRGGAPPLYSVPDLDGQSRRLKSCA